MKGGLNVPAVFISTGHVLQPFTRRITE